MNKFIVISIVCLFLIVNANSQTTGWSSWADCAKPQGCFRRRIFMCDAGEGLQCFQLADGAFEQRALNCDVSPECLEDVTEMFHASEVSKCCSSFILYYRVTIIWCYYRFFLFQSKSQLSHTVVI